MRPIGFSSTTRYISATLTLLMLASLLVGTEVGRIVPVGAVPPWSISLEATITTNAYWGYYGGYHDIWGAIETAFADIGITVSRDMFDDFSWYDNIWDEGWEFPGTNPYPPGGWDMTILEWWLQPHAVEPWFVSMVHGDMVPETGYNIHPWRNDEADRALDAGMQSFVATTRQSNLWNWQRIFMEDPPWINLFWGKVYELTGSYLKGYDPSGCWFYDTTQLTINTTEFENVLAPGGTKPNADRYAEGNRTLIYAVTEQVWSIIPMFMDTYTEEQMATLWYDTLYRWSLTPSGWANINAGLAPNLTDYVIVPELAASAPVWMVGPNGPDTRARVDLRTGVVWSDGQPFTADDVVYSINVLCLEPRAKNSGSGDFQMIERVEKVDSDTVDFILYDPYPDFASCLADDWGGTILPKHALVAYDPAFETNPSGIKGCALNYDFAKDEVTDWLPCTGPFKATSIVPGTQVVLEKNPLWWGYGAGLGPYNIDKIILTWIADPISRKLAILNHDVDFGEYPVVPLDEIFVSPGYINWPHIAVMEYFYPASHPIWLNFNNEYISNRYIRLAMANQIPYTYIINEILPGWGINGSRALTYIMPTHYYGGLPLLNPNLSPYTQNTTKALRYMSRWYYSQTGQTAQWADGAVGDADFSGRVELDDYYVWLRCAGYWMGTEIKVKKNPPTLPYEYLPGQDEDADWLNDGYVDILDYYKWGPNYETEYPY